jgi:hypothetical protein
VACSEVVAAVEHHIDAGDEIEKLFFLDSFLKRSY